MPEPVALVLLHGAGQTPAAWDAVIAALHGQVAPFAPDLHLDTTFTLSGATRTVVEHIDSLDHRHVVLCGLSLGAVVAALAAAERPERVGGLALSAIQVRPSPLLMRFQNAAIRATPARLIARGAGPSKRDLLHVLNVAAGIDLTGTLPRLTMPALVLCGTNDRGNRAASRHAASLLPDGWLALVPGAGHEWNRTHPQDFAHALTPLFTLGAPRATEP